jgi:hypothetical protein
MLPVSVGFFCPMYPMLPVCCIVVFFFSEIFQTKCQNVYLYIYCRKWINILIVILVKNKGTEQRGQSGVQTVRKSCVMAVRHITDNQRLQNPTNYWTSIC